MVYIYFDVWFPITMVFVVIVIILSIWAVRMRRLRMRRATMATVTVAPVVVTSATHTAPGGYPVSQMPIPTNYQTNVYAPPYPTQGSVNIQMPMPQMPVAQPPPPGMSGYPPMPMPPQQQQYMNPPSYDAAVAGNSSGQPPVLPYEKQAPYNPSFTAH